MKFRPLHDRVVVKRIEEEAKTAGGIIIPDTAKEKPQQGEVIAVGPGARDEAGKINPLDVKVGERVLFGKWSGSEVKIDGEDLLIMKESDILGVLEAPKPRSRRPPKLDTPRFTNNQELLKMAARKTSSLAKTRAIGCCAASIFSPTR